VTKVLVLAAAAALLAVALGLGASRLGRDAVRAADTSVPKTEAAVDALPAVRQTTAARKVAAPSTAKRRAAACRKDEQSDSPSDNRDPALDAEECGANSADGGDPSGDDGAGPADETGPDDGGNGP